MKINIDYVAGCNQTYLEYLFNTVFVTGNFSLTLDDINARSDKLFELNNFSSTNNNKTRIAIVFGEDDLLHVTHASLTKRGSTYVGIRDLDYETLLQLDNEFMRDCIDDFMQLANRIPSNYNDIKGTNWPDVDSIQDFYNLPEEIQEECKIHYGFQPTVITKDNFFLDRRLMRGYFTAWFLDTQRHPLYRKRQAMSYPDDYIVYYLPFKDLWQVDRFLPHIDRIADIFKIDVVDDPKLPRNLKDVRHFVESYLFRYQHRNIASDTDQVLEDIRAGKSKDINLSVLQEAYINAKLSGKLDNITYIRNTKDIKI